MVYQRLRDDPSARNLDLSSYLLVPSALFTFVALRTNIADPGL